ncbi:MAG: hypothetical protein ABSD42_14865 [Candidatus Bathyarchaeia archaeon]|jgi:hypothetical protein
MSREFDVFFRRFENKVDIKSMNKDYAKLHTAIEAYSPIRWTNSPKQQESLIENAIRLGFKNITIDEWVPKTKIKKLSARARWERRARIGNTAPARKARRAYKSANKRAIKVELIKDYVDRKYSSNRIQKELKAEKMGIRRTELLKIIRTYKNRELKKDSKKYTPSKYRKK